MAWTSLSTRLATIEARVLAGPVLRQVVGNAVTVWLALREPATVALSVVDPVGTACMAGHRRTVAIGTHLHLVAVTAVPLEANKPLTEDVVYRYNITFGFADGLKPLAEATDNARLAYPPFEQPTFCLPPKNVNDLRILHGSCRIPHGQGVDHLPMVGDLIAQTVRTPMQRPHQLLLMGDQIYADDVAASMLVMLSDASDVLLGWKEILPRSTQRGGPVVGSKLPPFARRSLLNDEAKFTSEDLDGHLMTLGEYLCMYLFVWSDVLWNASIVPGLADVLANVKANVDSDAFNGMWNPFSAMRLNSSIPAEVKSLGTFASRLKDVRCALANIPSYMICDDHEVTDDWNMTLAICAGMYNNPLGRRVVKNGVVAYSLCQHWGNAPEQFLESDASLPGTKLLNKLGGGNAATYESNSDVIDSLVSVHTDTQVVAKKAVFHDAGSLIFNYTIEGPGHQVIVTDTRTWRSFPNPGLAAPDLLPLTQFVQQIQEVKPKTAGRALLVVLTTNAPPVQPIRSATRNDWIANHAQHFPDLYEAWDLPTLAFDRLIKSVSDRLPEVGTERRGPVILLSGDVHHAFASRLLYKATKRLEAPQTSATVVVAQLVASSIRKETGNTRDMGEAGYQFAPHWYVKPMIGLHMQEYYAGFNVPATGSTTVGRDRHMVFPQDGIAPEFESVTDVKVRADRPSLRVTDDIEFARAPDYLYQLDYLLTTKNASAPRVPEPLPALASGATAAEREQALKVFNVVTGNYRQYNADPGSKRQIIGTNNLGEVTFEWPDTDHKKVIHTVRWYHSELSMHFVDYVVDLNPNSDDFPLHSDRFKVVP